MNEDLLWGYIVWSSWRHAVRRHDSLIREYHRKQAVRTVEVFNFLAKLLVYKILVSYYYLLLTRVVVFWISGFLLGHVHLVKLIGSRFLPKPVIRLHLLEVGICLLQEANQHLAEIEMVLHFKL